MVVCQHKTARNYRHWPKQQGMTGVEVHVPKEDAALIEEVARALVEPEWARATRVFLRERFALRPTKGLKAPLSSAPLEGVDRGRDVDL
jgi:hypothetical protein